MRVIKALAVAGSLTAVAAAIGPATAASPAKTFLRCSVHAHLTAPLAQTGAVAGSVSCGRAYGKGSYHGRYRDNVADWPTVTETGSGRLRFKVGTLRGTYALGPAVASGLLPYRGTFHLTGGSGRFKHVSGTLTMTCSHRIPPLTNCTMSGSVSGATGTTRHA